MEKTKVRKREWVKTFIIIFLVILLLLTFFSNTIMNRSLPEVAAQYSQSGPINAKIRGTGQVSANETYDVTLSQTRKIKSVMIQVGDNVTTGDTLFVLEPMDSEELKSAQNTLAQMELDYQKSLINMSNGNSTEDREIQKLRKDYEEALAVYRLYSNTDPSQIAVALNEAKAYLKILERELQDANNAVSDANADLAERQQEVTELSGIVTSAEDLMDRIRTNEDATETAHEIMAKDRLIHGENYDILDRFTNGNPIQMAAYAEDIGLMQREMDPNGDKYTEDQLKAMSKAYTVLSADLEELEKLEAEREDLEDEERRLLASTDITDLDDASRMLTRAEKKLSALKDDIERLNDFAADAKRAVEDQQTEVDNYASASTAADSLQAAKAALEDKVFEQNLGSTENLDMQNAKARIDEQKKLVEQLTTEADGQEIKANVSGTISNIQVTAGNTAGADTPIATITVADRGYTLKIPVTAEQARQVRIGDTASIANYWSNDLTATLENIANDPQKPGQGKLLIFRITGEDVEPGSNMTLSIGQKSANYDCLVPNSAIRTDANGTFVLVVVAKNTPLGNRYVATRADVTVLASDDTSSAVNGIANGDFVITTSSRPIEAGNQVRLVDNT